MFRKLTITILILILFINIGCYNSESSKADKTIVSEKKGTLEFYLIKSETDNNVVTEDKPFLTERDIITYKWSEHKIIVSKQTYKKLPQDATLDGKMFLVEVNSKTAYRGILWNNFSSSNAPKSLPVIFTPIKVGEPISIQLVYPNNMSFDTRNNGKVYDVLKSLGKIEE